MTPQEDGLNSVHIATQSLETGDACCSVIQTTLPCVLLSQMSLITYVGNILSVHACMISVKFALSRARLNVRVIMYIIHQHHFTQKNEEKRNK